MVALGAASRGPAIDRWHHGPIANDTVMTKCGTLKIESSSCLQSIDADWVVQSLLSYLSPTDMGRTVAIATNVPLDCIQTDIDWNSADAGKLTPAARRSWWRSISWSTKT